MLFISHRGNTDGPRADENSPDRILEVLGLGFDVEIDVWFIKGKFWLGHDAPTYKVPETFLYRSSLWCHAKNHEALNAINSLNGVDNFFWHQNDDIALTSSNHFWVYPGKMSDSIQRNAIYVMPETIFAKDQIIKNTNRCFGVCSDYVEILRNLQNE